MIHPFSFSSHEKSQKKRSLYLHNKGTSTTSTNKTQKLLSSEVNMPHKQVGIYVSLAVWGIYFLVYYAISVRRRHRWRTGAVSSEQQQEQHEHEENDGEANTKKKEEKHRRRQALMEIFQEQNILKVRVPTYIHTYILSTR